MLSLDDDDDDVEEILGFLSFLGEGASVPRVSPVVLAVKEASLLYRWPHNC